MWRPKPESNRRGRICKPGLHPFICAPCKVFCVPLFCAFLHPAALIPPGLGLWLWTQKPSSLQLSDDRKKRQSNTPSRLAPHSSWTYLAPVNTGLQQQALAATTPNAAGYRVTMSLGKSLRLFGLPPASCRTPPTY